MIPKYFTILMTEMRDAINFVGFWRSCPPPPMPPSPDATILNYLNESEGGGGATLFCRVLVVGFWHLPMTSPPLDDTILNYLNDRERGGAPLCRILTPPPPTSPKYFTILMTEMRDCYFCRILAPPNAPPPPSPDTKILNYLND